MVVANLVELLVAAGANVENRRESKNSPQTPLNAAIDHGHIDAVRLLARRVKDVNRDLPLHAAITAGLGGAKADFEQAHPIANATPEEREIAEEQAMNNLRVQMMELLLAAGASVNGKDSDGSTPLHCATSEGFKDVVELLLDKGADVNAKATHRYWSRDNHDRLFTGITPLHEAALVGDPNVADLLIARGAQLDATTESGQTPLHYAAGYGYLYEPTFSPGQHWHPGRAWRDGDVVELLIEKGCRVNAKDHDGATPLYYALRARRTRIAKTLIAAGAEKVAVKNEAGQTMLHDAYWWKDLELIRLLLDNGADTEERDTDGRTLLHLAARDPNQGLVELLLAHHADVNAKNRGGLTPLHYVASSGQGDLASHLLTHSADVSAQDDNGDTPLHSAALHGHKEVVELLVAHGADINAKNTRGRTPTEEAARRGHKDIVQLLSANATDTGRQ